MSIRTRRLFDNWRPTSSLKAVILLPHQRHRCRPAQALSAALHPALLSRLPSMAVSTQLHRSKPWKVQRTKPIWVTLLIRNGHQISQNVRIPCFSFWCSQKCVGANFVANCSRACVPATGLCEPRLRSALCISFHLLFINTIAFSKFSNCTLSCLDPTQRRIHQSRRSQRQCT